MSVPRPGRSLSEPKPAEAGVHDGNKIGFWTCTALVVGNVIGMGIFVLPASLAPFGFNALIGWVIVLAGCLVLARVFSHLAHALPDAGGPYGYIRQTLGEPLAYLALWAYWVSLWLTNAALATGVVGYMTVVFPPLGAIQPALFGGQREVGSAVKREQLAGFCERFGGPGVIVLGGLDTPESVPGLRTAGMPVENAPIERANFVPPGERGQTLGQTQLRRQIVRPKF